MFSVHLAHLTKCDYSFGLSPAQQTRKLADSISCHSYVVVRYCKSKKKLLQTTGPNEWAVYTVIQTARTRFQRHRFVQSSTIKSLSSFGNLQPATEEIRPSGYALFTGASGCNSDKGPLLLKESLSGSEEWMWSDLTLETTAKVLVNGVTRGAATLIYDGSYFYDLDPMKGGAC